MKMIVKLSGLLILGLLLVACGGADAADESSGGGDTAVLTLNEDYDDALPLKNQLLLGIIRLEETPQAITAGQAAELLPLWQAFAALTASGTAAPEETEAVQNQIIAALTPEQVAAIARMQLTNSMLQTFYGETGISEVQTPEPGVTPQSMKMSDLPQEAREATREASGMEPGGGGSGKSDALLEMTLELLAGKQ